MRRQCGLVWAALGRTSVATSLVEAGAFEVGAAHLRQSSAVEWVNWRSPAGLQAGAVFVGVGSVCQQQLSAGLNKTQLLVDSGMHELLAAAVKVRLVFRTRRHEDIFPEPAQHLSGVRVEGPEQDGGGQRLLDSLRRMGAGRPRPHCG